MPTSLERGICSECRQRRAVVHPRGGDVHIVNHRGREAPGKWCPGSKKPPLDPDAPQLPDLEPDPGPIPPADNVVAQGDHLPGHQQPFVLEELPATLTGGLTVFTDYAGLQIQPAHCALDDTVVALALRPNLPYDEERNLFLLDASTARAWRDLLNIATARGAI